MFGRFDSFGTLIYKHKFEFVILNVQQFFYTLHLSTFLTTTENWEFMVFLTILGYLIKKMAISGVWDIFGI